MYTLPNILTLSRIVVIPVVIGLFYVPGDLARWIACGLFVAAAVTDWFDGFLARRWNQVSALGRFLDPIADKLLVAAVLLLLVGFDTMTVWSYLPAAVILCREILVSGLREFLAEIQVSVPVTKLAKWKTTFQLVALTLLILGEAAPWGIPAVLLGEIALWVAAVMTIVTGWDYLTHGLYHMKESDRRAAEEAAQLTEAEEAGE
ncbi:CDP-diacylglycerol--glycerol-3-phosphate 3-phosphatidyltransferase [Caenispirillum salinarum AK4]|uniref:CDP-diacylglycerol--glycerol-3-phosphate 3-phosphatidyltransferase n=1 Tax=Caenispirillum salinarum AK4 TaxID=1238182 RepID=K9H5H9_9PROT|nr:CDP-diacylglycerol--glycerol-3-phosphate 3-phosphatidyltransferase [Caenispirillum salinarum]EKV32349.1 CDP-diacylglycerol--glycerol-3-phosphate 3-phosphatidyltransferase [Caenispirillum salinarum AK4]